MKSAGAWPPPKLILFRPSPEGHRTPPLSLRCHARPARTPYLFAAWGVDVITRPQKILLRSWRVIERFSPLLLCCGPESDDAAGPLVLLGEVPVREVGAGRHVQAVRTVVVILLAGHQRRGAELGAGE